MPQHELVHSGDLSRQNTRHTYACVCLHRRFGSRARGLKNTVAVNVRLDPRVLQQQLDKARAQVREAAA
jgi:hypothetical protein